MDKKNFEGLVKSIKQMKLILKGKMKPGRVTKFDVVSIKAIRKKLHQSQTEFAFMIGVSPSTLRNWEQGLRRPEGPAQALLKVAQENPKAVYDALHS
ncbi:MAG: helix-turn-helix domain-containing protein [Candidatus Omnitrophica bacterium]|nr:helix-turn-helix domain-containing protein [Candidatus Omnitrophota bacterium]